MCLCVYKCSITSFPGIFPNTAIDQLQQHPDWMIPAWVTGSMKAHECTFGPRTKSATRNKDSLALFLPGEGIDRNGKRMCEMCRKLMMLMMLFCWGVWWGWWWWWVGVWGLANPKLHPQSWTRQILHHHTTLCSSLWKPAKRGERGWQQLHTHTHTHWSQNTESIEQWGQFHLWFFKEFGWYWFGAKVSSSFRQSGAFRSSWKELRPQPETEAETLSSNTLQCIFCRG